MCGEDQLRPGLLIVKFGHKYFYDFGRKLIE
jgi:hypothetical protein